ncbi:MAG TPA: chromosomal replication initiator protein DnaA [Phycisphaerae bacterium]|nr:chromosomal replication initiator protein DnaA [Phycisphaerae bacterium]
MDTVTDVVWSDILGHVRTRHPAISRAWFNQLAPGALDHGELTVETENVPQLTYLVDHCVRPFVEAAQAATGRLVSVRFITRAGETVEAVAPELRDRYSFDRDLSPARLNGDYLFENFVIGNCNRLAHASCVAASESPGTAYNPLFIHGSAGLGKTHLLQAVCHRILDRTPEAKIAYVTCETFVNHFVEAMERNALDGFRYRYRQVDLLLVDDIQFLGTTDRTQEEFFHTFNTLYGVQKQIVLTADCSPAELGTLEERLISRFNWGLVARIDAPCLETRLAIIKKKCRLSGFEIPEDVMMEIAERIKSNARELEGTLIRLLGLSKVEGRPIDMAMARTCLGDQPGPVRSIRMQDIMGVVTERFDVRVCDMQGRRRSRSIAFPRQVGMYLARQLTTHSLEEIGDFFGGRDHTTVLHAKKLVADRRANDPAFRVRLEEMEENLRRGGLHPAH